MTSSTGNMDGAGSELRERREMLQAGLDLMDQGITVFDADLHLVAWNETFLQMLGFPRELAYMGAPVEGFIRFNAEREEYGPGDVEALVAERMAAARSFRPYLAERRRPDGRILMLRGEPLPNRGYAILYSDITEQRYVDNLIQHQNVQLEERVRRRTAQLENANANLVRANAENSRIAAALGRSEARLRLINDTIPTLIGYFDKDQVFRYANKGYSDWFGIREESITGTAIPGVITEHVYEQVKDHIRTALSGQQVTYEYSMERGGRTLYARSTLVPEIGHDGETLGCFVFSYDITEQKRMQAALVQAQKMEAIGQLTGGLAHDFNNLLTVIIGNLAALQDRRDQDEEVKGFVEPALESARRGVQLIKRLLTFSRNQPLEPQAVDVGRLIGGMTTLVRRSLPESIAITTDLPREPLHSLVDPGQLESALLNFALNARDAMPDGGRLHLAARRVELGENAADFEVTPGSYVLVEVEDNGAGMDEETLARVFEPFFTTKRFGLGSGLGLSMVYGFVKQSGGGIRIRSAPGQGTTVAMVLPLGLPEVEPDDLADDAPLLLGGELVLLVEDEASVRRVVRQQLMDLGYPVIEAENGSEALALIDNVPDIAIVVTDVVMPGGINGRQLAGRLLESRPNVRVVLMSGYADGWHDGRADSLPVLTKPFDTQELIRALRPGRKENV
ncbi:MAG: PAS-domain containing protein [Actinomycetota bacterium]